MPKFYATRTQRVTDEITEHQLLSFGSADARKRYVDRFVATKIKAAAARNLFFADIWRTCVSKEADCVFSVRRYIP